MPNAIQLASEPKCSICKHPKRPAIERALLDPGNSGRAVARQFNLILSSLQRHRPHMTDTLDQARALREVEGLGELYKRQKARSVRLWEQADRVFALEAPSSHQLAAAARLVAEATKLEEILAKFAQTPGFREQQGGSQTHISAPQARIVVTSSPRGALAPRAADPDELPS